MAHPFEPRKILKQISNELLHAFFTERGQLLDVPWDELTEHKIEPVYEAWQSLPEHDQFEVQIILRDIHDLADHRGLAVLAEEILWRCPDHAEDFRAQTSKADKAMWVYLHVREAFDEAALFARADALAAGRHWKRRNSLPKMPLVVTDAMLNKLATALTSFYGPVQMRGRHCKVVHYHRHGGADYFFAYLDDYPDKHLVFDDDADQPSIRADRYAFENVFVYNADEGAMDVFAPGGKKVWEPLQCAFCKAVLDQDIAPTDPLKPSFKLDHLIANDFPLPTDSLDQVEEARITRMRLVPQGSGGYIEIKANPKAHPNDIFRKIDRWIRSENIDRASATVASVSFNLKFAQDAPGGQRPLTFNVSAPNSSDLKSKPDEKRAVGERCLKRWGVVNDEG